MICQVYTHPQVILFPNLRTTIFSSCEVIAQQMLTVTHAIRARKELEMTSRVDRVFWEMTSLQEDDFLVWILYDFLGWSSTNIVVGLVGQWKTIMKITLW